MNRPVFLLFPDSDDWVVRRLDAVVDKDLRFLTRRQAVDRLREIADAHAPSRVVIFNEDGEIEHDYSVRGG